MTWFKKDPRIKWLTDYKEIKNEVKNFITPNTSSTKIIIKK